MKPKRPARKAKPAATPSDTDGGPASWNGRLPQICAFIAAGIAGLALAGWQLKARFLAGQWGDYIPMAPSTALAFLLLGGALFSSARWPGQRVSRAFALAALSLVSSLGLLVLAQFVTGIDLGLEQALFRVNETLGQLPLGRMSPLTAISFLLESAALLILLNGGRWRNAPTAAALLAAGATAVNFIVLVGYAYGAPVLYGGVTVPTAFPTAVAFAVLGIGLIQMTAPDASALRAWSRTSPRGRLLRAFLPSLLSFILIEGWLQARLAPILPVNPALWYSLTALAAGVLIVVITGWIARHTADAIEEAQAALRRSEALLNETQEITKVGGWEYDVESGRIIWTDEVYRIYGLPKGEYDPSDIPQDIRFYALHDQARIVGAFRRAVETGEPYELELEFRNARGEPLWVRTVGRTKRREGKVVRVFGNIMDISARKRAEEKLRESELRYRTVIANAPVVLWATDHAGTFTFSEGKGLERLGLKPGEVVGASAFQLYQDIPEILEAHHQALEGKSVNYISKVGELIFESYLTPQYGMNGEVSGLIGLAVDITERKQAEEKLRHRAEEMTALYETSLDLIAPHDLTTLLQTIVERAVRLLGGSGGGLYLCDAERREVRCVVSYNTPRNYTGTVLPYGQGAAGTVAQTGQPLMIDDYRVWPGRAAVYEDEQPFTAVINAPLIWQGQVTGVLNVLHTVETRRFNQNDLDLLALFANQAALAVENARLLEEAQQRLRELTAIYDSAQRLQHLYAPDTLAQEIIHILEQTLQYEYGAVLLIDDATGRLRPFALAGPKDDPVDMAVEMAHVDSFGVRVGKGLTGWVAQTGQSVRLGDVRGDSRYLAVREGLRSELCVPLRAGERTLGVVNVESRRPDAYTESDQRVLETIAAQISVAIQNARLLEETRQRLAELEALHTVSTALRLAQTRDEALPILLDETLAALETDAGAIWLYDVPSGQLLATVIRGWFRQLGPDPTAPGEGIAGTVFATGKPYYSVEFARDPLAHPQPGAIIPPGWGGACLPIRTEAETAGVLFISVPLPRQITAEQARLLESLAEMAGAALHRMRLHEETARRLEQLQALHQIDLAITASLDLRVTLDVLLQHVTAQLHVDAASVLLLNPHAHTLDYAAGRGFRTRAVEDAHIRLGESFAGRAALERRAVQADSVQIQASPQFATFWASENFAAYYGVPLIAKGQVKGVLEVFHRGPLAAEPEWVGFLETLAGQAAIAIDNAQLFDNLQSANLNLSLAYDATIEGWSHALDLRDRETEGHTLRVTELTLRLARQMGFSEAELVHIRRGALLHDIGKMGVPDEILLKPGKLTDAEWVSMRRHPTLAYELLAPIAYLRPALDIPYYHHEKWDGTGYPHGLKGEQIPLAARLFAVVDVWDALRSDRPYRQGWPEEKVIEHIKAGSGTHFDSQAVEAFLEVLSHPQ